MQPIAMVLPIRPGKTKKAKEFAKMLMTERSKEFAASEKRQKVTKETWFLNPSEGGDVLVIYFEAADLKKAFEGFMKSKNAHDVWMKKELSAISGVDMSSPMEGPLPEQILAYGF
ncbi:MAG TPA: DUF6176 family protein [Conexivisphaerales archaeon]|nr:DUF6176 family protein [Conexivisphaerales archaeon]